MQGDRKDSVYPTCRCFELALTWRSCAGSCEHDSFLSDTSADILAGNTTIMLLFLVITGSLKREILFLSAIIATTLDVHEVGLSFGLETAA